MSIDTRTPAEIAYDNLKSGAVYTKSAASCPACSCEFAASAAFCDQCGGRVEPVTAAESDEYTPLLSRVWEAILDITSDPTNDGSADVCSICGAEEDCDCDDSSEAERARENAPVPPVPLGYPTDRAMIYQTIGTVFLCIDRRDTEMVVCTTGVDKDSENVIILPPAYVLALAQFLSQADMRELVAYHLGAATVTA